jgi:hypothetical protein
MGRVGVGVTQLRMTKRATRKEVMKMIGDVTRCLLGASGGRRCLDAQRGEPIIGCKHLHRVSSTSLWVALVSLLESLKDKGEKIPVVRDDSAPLKRTLAQDDG